MQIQRTNATQSSIKNEHKTNTKRMQNECKTNASRKQIARNSLKINTTL